MHANYDRILTTHVGSLPRPKDLLALLVARERGETYERAGFDEAVREAVMDVVARQVETGIDVVNDGEMSKISYSTYLKDRVDGFGDRAGRGPAARDLLDFIDYARQLVKSGGTEKSLWGAACVAPLALKSRAPFETDIANMAAAREAVAPVDAFMTACSPGVASVFLHNQHYPSEDAYLEALAGVLKDEYAAIVEAGVVLQLDCPDLAMGRHIVHADKSVAAFREVAARHIEVLNAATAGIAPDRMRLHLCWGNYEGPHHHDIPLDAILDLVYGARPQAISFEGANPRHEHEWDVFEAHPLPDDRIIIPGVIDSTSNFIEHPKLVAQRICRYADVVGRERVIAGSDCGFATFAERPAVHPDIAWAKLGSLVEGARIASDRLFPR